MKLGCHLACLHADNRIRVYDIKSRRRKPIADIHLAEVEKADNKSKLTKFCVSKCENYFYVANARGSIYEVDAKKNYQIAGKFKGITTTIKDMQLWEDKLAVISLDGYLRIFNINTK